jgi:hypothetical protein
MPSDPGERKGVPNRQDWRSQYSGPDIVVVRGCVGDPAASVTYLAATTLSTFIAVPVLSRSQNNAKHLSSAVT